MRVLALLGIGLSLACTSARVREQGAELHRLARSSCLTQISARAETYQRPEGCPVCGPADDVEYRADLLWHDLVTRPGYRPLTSVGAGIVGVRARLVNLFGEGSEVVRIADGQVKPGRRISYREADLFLAAFAGCREAL